jgi:hypothetical protein
VHPEDRHSHPKLATKCVYKIPNFPHDAETFHTLMNISISKALSESYVNCTVAIFLENGIAFTPP